MFKINTFYILVPSIQVSYYQEPIVQREFFRKTTIYFGCKHISSSRLSDRNTANLRIHSFLWCRSDSCHHRMSLSCCWETLVCFLLRQHLQDGCYAFAILLLPLDWIVERFRYCLLTPSQKTSDLSVTIWYIVIQLQWALLTFQI